MILIPEPCADRQDGEEQGWSGPPQSCTFLPYILVEDWRPGMAMLEVDVKGTPCFLLRQKSTCDGIQSRRRSMRPVKSTERPECGNGCTELQLVHGERGGLDRSSSGGLLRLTSVFRSPHWSRRLLLRCEGNVFGVATWREPAVFACSVGRAFQFSNSSFVCIDSGRGQLDRYQGRTSTSNLCWSSTSMCAIRAGPGPSFRSLTGSVSKEHGAPSFAQR